MMSQFFLMQSFMWIFGDCLEEAASPLEKVPISCSGVVSLWLMTELWVHVRPLPLTEEVTLSLSFHY